MWHRNPLRTIETSFLWFLSLTLTLNTIPRMVLRAIRGEGSKTQVYVSFPHSLFAWKLAKKNPAALEFTVSYVLSFLVEWRRFLSSISFDLKMRIKMCGSRCSFLPVPWSVLWSGLLPPLCSVILSHLFPFHCQEQTQIFNFCRSFPDPVSSSGARTGLVPHG